jgi:uncharacterized membrane protein (DUF4010 family)
MVVTVAGIGGLNYVLIQRYDGRGVAVTGFLGGLVSSTAVVGTMLDHVRDQEGLTPVAVAGVLLANAAMALRNLGVVLVFTVAADRPPLVGAVLPLGALAVGAVAVALWTADWSEPLSVELSSPFSIRNAITFGGAFLVVLAATELARTAFGTAGLYASAALSGLVTSAGATTSVVLLYRSAAPRSPPSCSRRVPVSSSKPGSRAPAHGSSPAGSSPTASRRWRSRSSARLPRSSDPRSKRRTDSPT